MIKIGGREFDTERHCYVMGILNVTPDSFSDGGKYEQMDQALFRAEEMIEEGADLLDIGGESTRPGYTEISTEEEKERVIPVIEKIKSKFDIPISLDTCKADVAKAGIAAGADLINDIWGLKKDGEMAGVIAAAGVPCCLAHNRRETTGQLSITDVIDELRESLSIAERAGIARGRLILDPGIGFGKTYEQNLRMIAGLNRLHALGCPLLLGCSRKSVVGLTLGLPVDERLEGTLVTTAIGVLKGCGFVRVHDVKANVRAVRMAEAVREFACEQEERDWHRVFIALGSNMGDRLKFLERAVANLREDSRFREIRVSDYIETAPYGGVEQGDFLNGVLEAETLYSPEELLKRLQKEEALAERKREIHWGPRTLDLDILLYDDLILNKKELTIPHPDMKNRRFVLEPLAELAPHLVHPVYCKTISELLREQGQKIE